MARGKRVHWSQRRKAKKQKLDTEIEKDSLEQVHENNKEEIEEENKNHHDRRASFPEAVHAGSYASNASVCTEQDEAAIEASKAPKRRYALWIAFCGSNYVGMQMNPGVKSIEAELERALFLAGGIDKNNFGKLQKIGWSRAARTDKGVHAAGQLVTAKLHEPKDLNQFVDTINRYLPQDIQILRCVRTTKNFHAKNSCEKRTYEYIAPTFLFAPMNQENQIKSKQIDYQNSGNWHVQPLEQNEIEKLDKIEKDYRITSDVLEKLKSTLSKFHGTHNFHNYTSKLEPQSPKCKRFIISFTISEPFLQDGKEWIRMKVIGQSFLLHHIRKMIGITIDVVRGGVDESIIEKSFESGKMDIPRAPGLGLLLEKTHFDYYNNRQDKEHVKLCFDSAEDMIKVEEFKKKYIFASMWKVDHEERVFSEWLRVLQQLPFNYKSYDYHEWKIIKEKDAKASGRNERRDLEQQHKKEMILQSNSEASINDKKIE